MPAPKAVWAIDIGQCALKAIHARSVDDHVEVDQFVTIEHEQILSQPDADEPALIRQSLKKLVEKVTFGKDPMIVSVPGHRSFARFSKLPPVEPKKIPDIVHFEATQQIPFGIDEVIWDYQIFQSPDSPELEVGIFAIKRALMSQYLSYFQELGLAPSAVQTAPIAIYNACLYESLVSGEAHIFADVGAQNTNFLIAEGHRLWLRNIPIGGNNFTETLQKSFKLNFSKAEQLKRTAATSKYARAVFQSMRPVFSDLAAEFQRSIGFYTSVNRESQVQKLYALGNAFRLPGLLKFLQQNTSLDVERVEVFSKLKLAAGQNEAEFSENVSALAVAYGLAIQGLGLAQVQSDLMPPEMANEMLWRGKQYWFAGAAAGLMVGALAVWGPLMGINSSIDSDKERNGSQAEQKVSKYEKLSRDYQALVKSGDAGASQGLPELLEKVSERRLIIPQVMTVLTSAVSETKVQPTLAAATTAEDYAKAAKEVERSERRQVFATSIDTEYVSPLTPEVIEKIVATASETSKSYSAAKKPAGGAGMMGGPGMMGPGMMGPGMMGPGMSGPGMGGPGAMGGPGMGPGGPGGTMGGPGGGYAGGGAGGGYQGGGSMSSKKGSGATVEDEKADRGFVVTIQGRTPFGRNAAEAVGFLNETVLANLKKIDAGQASKTHMWIDNVKLDHIVPMVSESKPAERSAKADYTDLRQKGSSKSVTPVVEEDLGPKDPVTGELMSKDWVFTLHCVVHTGPAPEVAEDQAGAADGTTGKAKKRN